MYSTGRRYWAQNICIKRVKHARVCVFDASKRYAQKTNSLVLMSWPIAVILLSVLMAVGGIHVKALAIQLNMFCDCYGS